MRSPQFWVALVCLAATLLLLHVRGDVDQVPPSAPLSGMPINMGRWTGEDVPIASAVLEILGKGDFLNRVYTPSGASGLRSSGERANGNSVGLFIAYFPTQRTGQAIHSPQNCLPGAGWTFLSSGVTSFSDEAGKNYRVGEYVISDGTSKQEVLYWYQTHGRAIASDYAAKLHMLTDSIRLGRTDAALVRVITPIQGDERSDEAHERAVNFAMLVVPLLPAYVPN